MVALDVTGITEMDERYKPVESLLACLTLLGVTDC